MRPASTTIQPLLIRRPRISGQSAPSRVSRLATRDGSHRIIRSPEVLAVAVIFSLTMKVRPPNMLTSRTGRPERASRTRSARSRSYAIGLGPFRSRDRVGHVAVLAGRRRRGGGGLTRPGHPAPDHE